MSRSRLPRSAVSVLTAVIALVATLLLVAPAEASIKAPTGLTPTGAASSSTPTFSWSRVSHATGYQIVVTSNATQQQVVNTSTANNKFVPTNNLADGSYSWQVRANGSTGTSSWASATTTISPTAPPSPTSPVGSQHLAQPASPALLKWSAVSGADGYEIQVDNTGSWVNPTTYSAKGNSYFVDTPQAPGTWYWRVRASRGQGFFTSWSSTASYVIDQLPDPQAAADMNTGTPLQDVRIDWLPVDGAMAYQLQVGKDVDFNNIVDDRVVDGTSFSPPTTYDNGSYYWRVRAIDAGQNRMPWTASQPFTFQRDWPDKPTLQYPLDQLAPAVGKPMYYQWTPVRHATRYQVDVSTDPNFSPATIHTCYTSGTTLSLFDSSPADNRACGPQGQGVATYWRVRAIDDGRGVLGIFSSIRKYIYDAGAVTLTSPANGATVDVPTLNWNATPETEQYEVILKDKNGNQVSDITTHSTSWTPENGQLTATGSPYSWTVQSIDARGSKSPLYPGRTFSVSGNMPTSGLPALTPLTGVSSDPATDDFPDLSWVPMNGATYYRLQIGVVGSGFWDNASTSHINNATYAYPAATDTDTHYLAPGQYVWRVIAYDGSGQIGTGPATGQFTIKELADATGQRIALDANAELAGHSCANALSNIDVNSQICIGVPATPVLSWDPVPRASGYLVYLANDQALTNAVINPYAVTTNTMFRPPNDLPDNTAQNSYYWYIRPCKVMNPLVGCTADPASTNAAATNAFRKQSPAVQLQTPADGASLATDPAFVWTDYYDTNQAIHYAGGTDPSYQTAKTYRIQISQSSTFSSTVDDREVDQPFYSPSDHTLPQGKLYWRVQVVDPVGNHLTWSPVRSFSNDQPAINLAGGANTAPAIGATVGGATPFRWTPMDGASSYQIEVYRNNDSTHSDANRVISATTRVPAFVSQNYLPTSSASYRWRVRWIDADGQPRPWSSDATFSVKSTSMTVNSPAANTYQPNNGLYFTWNPVAFASSYYLEVRDANSGGTTYQVTTAATANAPSQLGDGSYTWRVSALDPNGNPIAVSSWRAFSVDSQGPVVTSASPQPSGTPKSKVKVSFNEKVFGVSTSSFVLHVAGRSSKLPAHVKVATNKRGAVLTPNSRLKKGKTYTVKVTKAVHDKAGNHMATYTWSFSV